MVPFRMNLSTYANYSMTRSTRDLSATSELLVELTVGTGQTDGQIDGPPREWSHNKTKKVALLLQRGRARCFVSVSS